MRSQRTKDFLPTIENKHCLVEYLKHSSVQLLCVDQNLGELGIKLWADASVQVKKAVFLRLPSNYKLPNKRNRISWGLKRLIDMITAALLLVTLSPLLLVLVLLIRVHMPGPILFRQWRVGERGKLFQIIKFRTMVVDAEKLHHQVMANQIGLHKLKDDPRITSLGRWMRKYSVDELPQLFNVLRGEMSLVGPRPWALYDALRICPERQQRLNALPGITGPWQVEARSNLLELDAVNNYDLEYLDNWSLWKDLKILLVTIPKVFSGFGAC
jgi:lipopolysaccharide/colanic/teichoic acid biosynthesis glycosyltransferase